MTDKDKPRLTAQEIEEKPSTTQLTKQQLVDAKAEEIMKRLRAERKKRPLREIKSWDCPSIDCLAVSMTGLNYYHDTSFHLYYDEAVQLVEILSEIMAKVPKEKIEEARAKAKESRGQEG